MVASEVNGILTETILNQFGAIKSRVRYNKRETFSGYYAKYGVYASARVLIKLEIYNSRIIINGRSLRMRCYIHTAQCINNEWATELRMYDTRWISNESTTQHRWD